MTVSNRPVRILLAALSLSQSACSLGSPGDAAPVPPAAPSEWQSWGATPGGTHFSTAAQVTPANVAQLELAWSHRSGDFQEAQGEMMTDAWRPQTSLQVTPIVVDSVMY